MDQKCRNSWLMPTICLPFPGCARTKKQCINTKMSQLCRCQQTAFPRCARNMNEWLTSCCTTWKVQNVCIHDLNIRAVLNMVGCGVTFNFIIEARLTNTFAGKSCYEPIIYRFSLPTTDNF